VEEGEGEYAMSRMRRRSRGQRTRRWTAVEEDKGRKSTMVEGDDEVPGGGGECRGEEEKNGSDHMTVEGVDRVAKSSMMSGLDGRAKSATTMGLDAGAKVAAALGLVQATKAAKKFG
jgi:hypothetical protein